MQDIRRPVLMLFLLLLTSLGPALQTDENLEISASSDEAILLSQSQRLELASSLWQVADSIPLVDVELRPSSGILRIQAGEFDPLLTDGPVLDDHFMDVNDPLQTGLAFVQLHQHDGTVLESLIKDYSITPLDYIADEGWLVRLASPPLSSLEALQDDDRIRWAGIQHLAGECIHHSSNLQRQPILLLFLHLTLPLVDWMY